MELINTIFIPHRAHGGYKREKNSFRKGTYSTFGLPALQWANNKCELSSCQVESCARAFAVWISWGWSPGGTVPTVCHAELYQPSRQQHITMMVHPLALHRGKEMQNVQGRLGRPFRNGPPGRVPVPTPPPSLDTSSIDGGAICLQNAPRDLPAAAFPIHMHSARGPASAVSGPQADSLLLRPPRGACWLLGCSRRRHVAPCWGLRPRVVTPGRHPYHGVPPATDG